MNVLGGLLLVFAGMLGWGGLWLRLGGVSGSLSWTERASWAVPLGAGMLGWLGFWLALGHLAQPLWLAVICLAGVPGLLVLGRPPRPSGWSVIALMLTALLGVLLAISLVAALAPPTDADSLTYHFAVPRHTLLENRLLFSARAVDGAVPLLQQMGYMVGLGLGGEQAMTLSCVVSAWGAVALTYAFARRHLSREWALGLSLAVATMPAFVYGAGAGQVEVRLAALTIVLSLAIGGSAGTRHLGYAVLAGLAAGFAIATKYPALFLAAIGGLAILMQRRGLTKATVYGLVALLAGAQWYVWNWWNTGDPVFPMLFGLLPYRPGTPWSAEQHAFFSSIMSAVELPLPRSWWTFFSYPFFATLTSDPVIESGRTGMGPLPLLLLPFALAGAWMNRRRILRHPDLLAAVVLVGGFYVLWAWFGFSQRVRHYLPVVPIMMIALCVLATRVNVVRSAVAAALLVCIAVQLPALPIYSFRPIRHVLSGESRRSYLGRIIGMTEVVEWVNTHLGPSDRVLLTIRQWDYGLDVPFLLYNPNQQAEVTMSETTSPQNLWASLRRANITYALVLADPDNTLADSGSPLATLASFGCAATVAGFIGPMPVGSRTLLDSERTIKILVVRLMPDLCRL